MGFSISSSAIRKCCRHSHLPGKDFAQQECNEEQKIFLGPLHVVKDFARTPDQRQKHQNHECQKAQNPAQHKYAQQSPVIYCPEQNQ
jgi:hypothetical protein